MLPITTLLCIATLLAQIKADSDLDATRTGSYYTDFPIYRSGSGTNTVKVQIGSPGIEAQLSLSTNVNFIQIVSDRCSGCSNAVSYDPTASSTWNSSTQDQVNIVVYPQAPEDTLTFTSRLGTDIVLDSRGEDQVAYAVAVVDQVESGRDGTGEGSGRAVSLGRGVSGFYGLGINQQDRQLSIVATMLNADNYPPNQPVPKNVIVGFDIGPYVNQAGVRAGSMHWGAVPQGKWVGDFNWLECDQTVGGSWAISIDNIRMGGNVIDTAGLYVPDETLKIRVAGFIQSMSLSIQSATYHFNPTQLVQPRDGQSCFSQVQAWTNGSVAEEQGEIRLGTSFMSGVYSAIYYSPNQQFLGLAGKPGSVNDFNVAAQSRGMPNLKLAGILIGTLLGALLILFAVCYSRNRSTFQSVWARGTRQMQRAQMNAVVRSTTIPPPMMGGPMMGAPMMGGPPMMPMGHPAMLGAMGPMGMGPMGGAVFPGQVGAPYQQQYPYQPHPVATAPYSLPTIPAAEQSSTQQQRPLMTELPRQRHSLPAPRSDAYYSPPLQHTQSAQPPSGGRRHHDRHSAPVAPRQEGRHQVQDSEARPRNAQRTAERAGKAPRSGHPGRALPKHREESLSGRTDIAAPEALHTSYLPPSKPLYDPHGTPHDGHRFSRPEYDHAPPGSATSKSMWNFGKAKSVARGYESVPRHAFEHSGGEMRHQRGGGEGEARWQKRDVEVDISDGTKDWQNVERNRELEGLTAAKAWRRQ